MEKSFAFVGFLMILPAISCGVSSYGQVKLHRSDYNLDPSAGGWLKFHRLPLTWEQAHLVCHNDGAVLASPTNKTMVKTLTSLMVKHGVTMTPIFTGLRNTISNSVQKSMEGVAISNTFIQTSENCVGMEADGTRVDISCLEYHPFVCFFKQDSKPQTECSTTDPEYVFDNRTGSCYKVYRDQHKWDEASLICKEQGGHLAVINSQTEAEVIWELAKESTSEYAVVIGFRSNNDQNVWRDWTTVQGQTLEEAGYARWYKGEPNSIYENCGSVIFRGSKDDGILNDVSCDMDLMFICEIEPNTLEWNTHTAPNRTIPEPQAQKRSQEVVCNVVPECDTLDTEYVLNNQTGSCYKVHQNQRNWTQAYEVCAGEGGHLAVINSQEEAEVVWDIAERSPAEYSIFIGYRAFSEQRIWITVQGQTLAEAGYNKWNWGEPSDIHENCGGLNGGIEHGILNDVACEIELMFICEIEPRMATYLEARN